MVVIVTVVSDGSNSDSSNSDSRNSDSINSDNSNSNSSDNSKGFVTILGFKLCHNKSYAVISV